MSSRELPVITGDIVFVPYISTADSASVELLGTELHNDHDAGARWCAAYLLADSWATPEHPANASAATALELDFRQFS